MCTYLTTVLCFAIAVQLTVQIERQKRNSAVVRVGDPQFLQNEAYPFHAKLADDSCEVRCQPHCLKGTSGSKFYPFRELQHGDLVGLRPSMKYDLEVRKKLTSGEYVTGRKEFTTKKQSGNQ